MHPAEISKSAARYSLFAFSVLFSAVNSNALTPAIIPNIHNVSIKSIIVYSYIYEVADVSLRDYHFYIIIVCLIKITYGVRYLHSILFLCCLFRSTALNHHLVLLLLHFNTNVLPLFIGVKIALVLVSVVCNLVVHTIWHVGAE